MKSDQINETKALVEQRINIGNTRSYEQIDLDDLSYF